MKPFITIINTILLASLVSTLNAQSIQAEKSMGYQIVGGTEYVIFQHEVSNFEEWKKTYLKDEAVRSEAGLREVLLLQGSENPNELTIIFEYTSSQKVVEFISNPDLAEKMQKAGVMGKPHITFFKPENTRIPTHNSFLLVKHKVKDYEVWRKGFDEDEAVRKDNNLNLVAVGKDLKIEDNVVVLICSDSPSSIISFMENSGLKEKMAKVGVISEPEIDIMNQYR